MPIRPSPFFIRNLATTTPSPCLTRHLPTTVTTTPTTFIRRSTTSHTMPRSFLLIGLSWDEFPKVAPPDQREVLEAKIKAGLETARQQFQDAGLDYKMEHYGMSDDMGKLEGWMKEKKWDGVVMCVHKLL